MVFGLEEAVEIFQSVDRRPALETYASSLRDTVSAANTLRDPQRPLVEIQDPVGKPFEEGAAIARHIHGLTVRLARLLSP